MSDVRVIQSLYQAFGKGDVPAVLGSFTPDIDWRQAEGNPYQPSGEPWTGPNAVLENLFMRLGTEWDGFTVHPKRFHDAGGTVVVEGRYTGTFKPTKKSLDCQFCHVWTLRGGKIAAFQQYVDTGKLQAVMQAR